MDETLKPAHAAPICVGLVLNGRPVVQASELFAGCRFVIIQHEGEEYRLEITRNGKLILKK